MKQLLLKRLGFPVLVLALAAVLYALPLLVSNSYELRVWMLLLIYALVALGLNILTGLTGLVSLGQAGIFAVGAYAVAVLSTKFGLSFIPCMAVAIALSAALGALLAYPTVRVRGVYLTVITIAFGIIVENIAIEWQSLTGGTGGISSIPHATLFGVKLDDNGYFYLLVAMFLAAFIFHYNVIKSRYGRAMRAVNQSETAARTVGINPIVIRLMSFVIAAGFAGAAGGAYAYLNRYVNPDTFRFDDSVRFLLMVILGGSGTIFGPVLGAGVLTFIPELLQAFGAWQRFAYGALLALVMFGMPFGIVGTFHLWTRRFGTKVSRRSRPWPCIDQDTNALLHSSAKAGDVCLRTDELSMAFGGLIANDKISESLKSGMVHSVIGPNGAGKSTFINCISGFYKPTSGRITFMGQPATGKGSHQLARMGLARTFQNTELFGDMTVLENVLVGADSRYQSGLFATLFRLPSFFADERRYAQQAQRLLEYVGLDDYAQEKARNLPFGHQRCLEIARALAMSPTLLLLDEPAAGLTHGEIEDLMKLIRNIASHQITVLLVEHHVDMIMAISDHVTVLDYGKVIASGTVQQVRNDPAVIEAYFGTGGTIETVPSEETV
ncbi:MAG: branched-chain amino acid ABC transporter ATP-binding protein/permease [Herminiimonas sp.]|nr:branched-chain amino acid ABC transporter ATP-binding protein/permease [Herminiimonas sp.]